MVEYTPQERDLDTIFMALADGTRRRLVRMLAEGSHTMTELAAPFDMSLAAVSKHVQVLERAGLVSRRVDGRKHYISLRATPLAQAVDWIAVYRRFWEDKLNRLEETINKET